MVAFALVESVMPTCDRPAPEALPWEIHLVQINPACLPGVLADMHLVIFMTIIHLGTPANFGAGLLMVYPFTWVTSEVNAIVRHVISDGRH